MTTKLESVIARLHQLPPAELDLIDFILEGIESGVEPYGRFDPATDKRDLPFEAAKEFRDAFVYFAGDFMKKTLARRQRIECFKKDLEYRQKKQVEVGLNELVDACTVVDASASFDLRDGELLEVCPPASEVLP